MFNVPFYYYLCMYLYNGKSPCLISAIVITVACATVQKNTGDPKKAPDAKKLSSLKSVLSLSKVE